MGALAYDRIKEFKYRTGDSVIEIGAERGEGSTEFLREYCKANNLRFYSVDINPQIEGVIKADGATWLNSFDGVIGFAYLDNFDYIFDHIKGKDWVRKQIEDYARLGIEMNNKNSEEAHFNQAVLVHKRSRVGTEVLFDDTWHDKDYRGKGALAVPYLIKNGYEVVHKGKDYAGYVHLRRVK